MFITILNYSSGDVLIKQYDEEEYSPEEYIVELGLKLQDVSYLVTLDLQLKIDI